MGTDPESSRIWTDPNYDILAVLQQKDQANLSRDRTTSPRRNSQPLSKVISVREAESCMPQDLATLRTQVDRPRIVQHDRNEKDDSRRKCLRWRGWGPKYWAFMPIIAGIVMWMVIGDGSVALQRKEAGHIFEDVPPLLADVMRLSPAPPELSGSHAQLNSTITLTTNMLAHEEHIASHTRVKLLPGLQVLRCQSQATFSGSLAEAHLDTTATQLRSLSLNYSAILGPMRSTRERLLNLQRKAKQQHQQNLDFDNNLRRRQYGWEEAPQAPKSAMRLKTITELIDRFDKNLERIEPESTIWEDYYKVVQQRQKELKRLPKGSPHGKGKAIQAIVDAAARAIGNISLAPCVE